MKIFYLAYLSNLNGENRFCSPAANNVCSYIKDVLVRNSQDDVVLVNLAQSKRHLKFSRRKEKRYKNITFINSPCFGSGRFLSKISSLLLYCWIKKYLKKNASLNDKVIIYHSLNTLSLEKFLSRAFYSILQVEEVYCDIFKKPQRVAISEIETINMFKKHVFVSNTLKDNPRIKSHSNVIFYGSYALPSFEKQCERDQKSIVYAGTLDQSLGIEFACDLMQLLPDYKLFVYGHGSKARIEELTIKYKNCENIIFCGQLSEEELEKKLFLYKYGISPRNPKTSYSSTSFPSKILTYLKSGLIVISSKLESIVNSPISDCIVFADYDIQSFQNAIIDQSSFFEGFDSTNKIKELDIDFSNSLFELIYED